MKYLSLALGFSIACALWMETSATDSARSTQPSNNPSSNAIVALYDASDSAEYAVVPVSQTSSFLKTSEACYTVPESDREVASGSVSSRWSYIIIREGRSNAFYVVYWRQNNCSDVFYTPTYSRQNDAYRAFRTLAEDQAY